VKRLDLKPLTNDLLEAALQLDQVCLGGLWTFAGYEREIDSPNSDLLVLQDSSSSLLGIACLWAIAEEAHITLLAVHPNYRRQGLGQTLLYAMLAKAWLRQLEWATLEVRVSNPVAIALYRAFGFQDVGRRRRYYQDTGEDALILWLKGLQEPDFTYLLQNWWNQTTVRLSQSGWHLTHDPILNLPKFILT
jgi:ribosomal-protein-alanine N-acetyltransferase